jgi:hypothetical protein
MSKKRKAPPGKWYKRIPEGVIAKTSQEWDELGRRAIKDAEPVGRWARGHYQHHYYTWEQTKMMGDKALAARCPWWFKKDLTAFKASLRGKWQYDFQHSILFTNKCELCGSTDLANYTQWYGGTIPTGVQGFIGCRACDAWEDRLSVAPSESIFDHDKWIPLLQGKGNYRSEEEKQQQRIFINRKAENLPRYDYSTSP